MLLLGLRDANGSVLLAGAKALGKSPSILQEEAWGLREGIRDVVSQGIKNIITEGDNLAVDYSLKNI